MCRRLGHVLHGAPGHVRRADEVDAEHLLPGALPLLVGRLGDRVLLEDARVVDEHVEAAERRSRGVDHRRTASGRRGRRRRRRAPPPAAPPRPPRRVAARAVVDRDAVAALGERAGGRRADPARGAGDEDRAAHGGDGTHPMLVGDEALRLLGNVQLADPGRPRVRQRLRGATRGRPRPGDREGPWVRILPDALANRTAGRQAAKRLTGSTTVPVLELDDGTAIFDSKRIVAWARANPAT